MSHRARSQVRPILVDDDDDDFEAPAAPSNKKRPLGFLPPSSMTRKKKATPEKPLAPELKKKISEIDLTEAPADVSVPAPGDDIVIGDDILEFDGFAKSNQLGADKSGKNDPDASDESQAPRRKRLRKRSTPPSISVTEDADEEPDRGAKKKKHARVDADYDESNEDTGDEELERHHKRKKSKLKREESTQGQLDFISGTSATVARSQTAAVSRIRPTKKSTENVPKSDTVSKPATIMAAFDRMMSRKKGAEDSRTDAVFSPPSAASKSSDLSSTFNKIVASPQKKFAVSRTAAPMASPALPVASATSEVLLIEDSDDKNEVVQVLETKYVKPAVATSSADMLWVDKYAPTSRAELAVQPKKLQQLADLLVQSLQDAASSNLPQIDSTYMKTKVIILQGPAGSGKTAAIRALSSELSLLSGAPQSFLCHEWKNIANVNTSYGLENGGKGKYDSSVLTPFLNWLTHHRGTSTLAFANQRSSVEHQVLVCEDMPNIFTIDQKEAFRRALRTILATEPFKTVVFIVTDESNGNSSTFSLFGDDILSSPHVKTITFRPVTTSHISQVLKRIRQAENLQSVIADDEIASLVQSADGDLRSAINSFQWLCKDKKEPPKTSAKAKRAPKKSPKAPKKSTIHKILLSKDVSISLFHALGKVVYNKRLNPAGEESALGSASLRPFFAASSTENHVKSRLRLDSPYWRAPLKSRPEQIMDKYLAADADVFTLLLHENYPTFLRGDNVIDEFSNSADFFSAADLLRPPFFGSGNRFADRAFSIAQESAALLSMYGIMYSNTSDTPRGKDTSTFRKSAMGQALVRLRENAKLASVLMKARTTRSIQLSSASAYLISGRDGAVEFIPFLRRINRGSDLGPSAEAFIELMSWYSQSKAAPTRSNNGTIDASSRLDVSDLENESEALERTRAEAMMSNFDRDIRAGLLAELQASVVNKQFAPQLVDDDIEDPDA